MTESRKGIERASRRACRMYNCAIRAAPLSDDHTHAMSDGLRINKKRPNSGLLQCKQADGDLLLGLQLIR